MAKFDVFSSENLLMSIGGHLIVIALMITSFVLVVDRATLVAPDRIEIVEIDLNSVRVSGDESILYNTNTPEITAPDKNIPEPEPVSAPDVAQQDSEITAPSMVDSEPEKKSKDAAPEPQPAPDEKPAPKKKTVVRVNRESVSLDRTLTVSVVDALRVAMTRCWTIDTTRPDISDIRAVAHLSMRKNGTVADVWFESASRAENDPAFAYVLDTIRSAINVCQPFRMLPVAEYDKWQKIQLTFYPTQGKVM